MLELKPNQKAMGLTGLRSGETPLIYLLYLRICWTLWMGDSVWRYCVSFWRYSLLRIPAMEAGVLRVSFSISRSLLCLMDSVSRSGESTGVETEGGMGACPIRDCSEGISGEGTSTTSPK